MRRSGAMLAGAFGACFSPSYDGPTCGTGGACPDGFRCVAVTNVCAREGEGAVDASPDRDASADGTTDGAVDAVPTDGIPTDGPTCTEGVESPSFPGRCFFAVDFALPWANARNNCMNAGAVLADIRTAAEQATVAALIASRAGSNFSWLGLSDATNEGDFLWISGATFDYSNWASGEPNNFNNEDCVTAAKTTGGWSDQACNAAYSSVCVRTVP